MLRKNNAAERANEKEEKEILQNTYGYALIDGYKEKEKYLFFHLVKIEKLSCIACKINKSIAMKNALFIHILFLIVGNSFAQLNIGAPGAIKTSSFKKKESKPAITGINISNKEYIF